MLSKPHICGTCERFKANSMGSYGRCHCNPPTVISNGDGKVAYIRPKVHRSDWCSRWKPRIVKLQN